MRSVWYVLTIALLISGCGGSSKVDNVVDDKIKQQTPKSRAGEIKIQKDQTLQEGSKAHFDLNMLDLNDDIVTQRWFLDGNLFSDKKSFDKELEVGEHEVTLEATDSDGRVYKKSITVTVKKKDSSNTPSTAKDLSFSIDEDSYFETSLSGSDLDGDKIEYKLVTPPKHGKLRGSAVHLRYTPDANYNGDDSFSYKVNDGKVDSNIATVTIKIAPVEDEVKFNNNISLPHIAYVGKKYEITLPLIDNDHIVKGMHSSKKLPAWLHIDKLKLYGTPTKDDIGVYVITLLPNERGNSNIGSYGFSIKVVGIDAKDDEINTTEDQNITINLLDNDKGDKLKLVEVDGEEYNSTFSFDESGEFRFSPATMFQSLSEGEKKSLEFRYRIKDEQNRSESANIIINIEGKNDAPILKASRYERNETISLTIYPVKHAKDPDNNHTLHFVDANISTTKGNFEVRKSSIDNNLDEIYFNTNREFEDLKKGEVKSIYITYRVADEYNLTSVTTITINLHGKNNPPVAKFDYTTTDYTINLDATKSYDDEGAIKRYDWYVYNRLLDSHTQKTSLDLIPGRYTIKLEVFDEDNLSARQEKSIDIADLAPIIDDISDKVVHEGESIEADINVSRGVAPFRYRVIEGIDGFSIDENSGHFNFDANLDQYQYLSKDENITKIVRLEVVDSLNQTVQKEFKIKIVGKNSKPVANDDNATTTQDSSVSINLLDNDRELDHNDRLVIDSIEAPSYGVVTIYDNNKSIKFDPDGSLDELRSSEHRNVVFRYTIKDRYGEKSSANVVVRVTGIDDNITLALNGPSSSQEGDEVIYKADVNYKDHDVQFDYDWIIDGRSQSATNEFKKLDFSVGEHNITLKVTDTKSHKFDQKSIILTVEQRESEVTFDTADAIVFDSNTLSQGGIKWLELRDLDRDGDIDILANAQSAFLFENKNGSFLSKIDLIASRMGSINIVRAFDLNGDGYLDLIYAKDGIKVCINDKDRGFDCGDKYYSGRNADDDITFLTVSDITDDATVEILTTSYKESTVNVFDKSSDENYSYNKSLSDKIEGKVFLGTLKKPTSIDSGDANGDNKSDIIVSGEKKFVYYQGDGDGDFTQKVSKDLNTTFVKFAQLDSDSDLEFVVSTADGKLIWYDIDGSDYNIPSSLNSITNISIADMDSDGDSDIIVADSSKVVWFENSNTNFFSHSVIENANGIQVVEVADLDGDGDSDIVVGDSEGYVKIYKNTTPIKHQEVADVSNRSFDLDDSEIKDPLTNLTWLNVQSSKVSFNEAKSECKSNGWRLPSVSELLSIVDNNSNGIDTIYSDFTSIQNEPYWADEDADAWKIRFEQHGVAQSGSSGESHRYICVKGKLLTTTLIRDEQNSEVVDKIHKLLWRDSSNALTNNITLPANEPLEDSDLCDNTNGWRIPTINELESTIDRKNTPKIKSAFKSVPDTNHIYYITNTSFEYNSTNLAYRVIDLKDGSTSYLTGDGENSKSDLYIRCVKDYNGE